MQTETPDLRETLLEDADFIKKVGDRIRLNIKEEVESEVTLVARQNKIGTFCSYLQLATVSGAAGALACLLFFGLYAIWGAPDRLVSHLPSFVIELWPELDPGTHSADERLALGVADYISHLISYYNFLLMVLIAFLVVINIVGFLLIRGLNREFLRQETERSLKDLLLSNVDVRDQVIGYLREDLKKEAGDSDMPDESLESDPDEAVEEMKREHQPKTKKIKPKPKGTATSSARSNS